MASVLVVEDDAAVRRLVVTILRAADHRALQATSIAEAVAILEDLGAAVDLVISDLGLPDGSGARVMLLSRRLRPGAPVLFITGSPDEYPAALCDVDEWKILGKPFRSGRLLETVERALAEATPPSEADPFR